MLQIDKQTAAIGVFWHRLRLVSIPIRFDTIFLTLRVAVVEASTHTFYKQRVNNLNNRRVGTSVYYRGIMGVCGNPCISSTKGNLKQLLAYWAHVQAHGGSC